MANGAYLVIFYVHNLYSWQASTRW